MLLLKPKNQIYIISVLDLFAVGLVVPFFSNYLRSLGVSHFLIGLLGSTYSGIQIISGPLIGSWSDVGDRKSVLKVSLLLCSVCYFVLGCSNSIIAICLVRILLGCVKHTQGISKAMISDLFSPGEQAEILSRSVALSSIAFSIAASAGGLILDTEYGFTSIGLLASLMFGINFVFATFLPNFPAKHEKGLENRGLKEGFIEIILNIKKVNWKENWGLFSIRFLSGLTASFFFSNNSFYLKEFFNLDQKYIGYIISMSGIIQTCTIFSIGHIKKIFYKDDASCLKRIFHFFILLTLSNILLCFANSLKIFLMFFIPFTISMSLLRITTMEFLLTKCTENQRGTFTGVSNSLMSFARFLTPVTSGIITDIIGIQYSLLLSVIPAVLGTSLCLKFINKKESTKKLS